MDPPVKIPYESLWSDVSKEENGAMTGKRQEVGHLSVHFPSVNNNIGSHLLISALVFICIHASCTPSQAQMIC